MPPAPGNIDEKPLFNVYGTMLVLSFLATSGAALMMRQELVDHWGLNADKNVERAVHITEMNTDPDKYPDIVSVTKTDLDEWKIINPNTPFPVKEKDYKWPEGYDPLANPVKPGVNNIETIPEAQRSSLMKDWNPEAAAAPEKAAEPAPAEKKDEGKTEEKKDEAKKEDGKTEEKKDEPKKDEAKKDEAKKDEPKTEEKKDETKKDEAKKDEAKKDEPKKDEPKKDEPKKEEAKKE